MDEEIGIWGFDNPDVEVEKLSFVFSCLEKYKVIRSALWMGIRAGEHCGTNEDGVGLMGLGETMVEDKQGCGTE